MKGPARFVKASLASAFALLPAAVILFSRIHDSRARPRVGAVRRPSSMVKWSSRKTSLSRLAGMMILAQIDGVLFFLLLCRIRREIKSVTHTMYCTTSVKCTNTIDYTVHLISIVKGPHYFQRMEFSWKRHGKQNALQIHSSRSDTHMCKLPSSFSPSSLITHTHILHREVPSTEYQVRASPAVPWFQGLSEIDAAALLPTSLLEAPPFALHPHGVSREHQLTALETDERETHN